MKKLFLVLILLVQLFILTGCKSSLQDITIGDQYIFTIEEDHYYIFFYKDGCSGCELVKPTILEYAKGGKTKIYAVNLHPEGKNQSRIFRKFTEGNTGQGTNGDFYVNGATKWTSLYIASTPSLIEIIVKTEKVEIKNEETGEYEIVEREVKKAYFIANGEKAINEFFASLDE